MWTTYCHVFEEDFQLIFMNHIRLLIRNQCGSHIIHGLPNPLAFQQNYSCYDGPSESGIFSLLDEPLLTSYLPASDHLLHGWFERTHGGASWLSLWWYMGHCNDGGHVHIPQYISFCTGSWVGISLSWCSLQMGVLPVGIFVRWYSGSPWWWGHRS